MLKRIRHVNAFETLYKIQTISDTYMAFKLYGHFQMRISCYSVIHLGTFKNSV